VIPQRVRLKGFLCYKDEQTVEFDGNATLWMLSGLNGSGKSAIFDAVTFALFGHHRGGGQHNHELINKESDTLTVEFDFLLDGKLYRAKRTLKRDTKGGARGTQQMFRFEAGDNGKGAWAPVEDTGQKREFDAWVGENIGLTYDTFTSSVLLLQGKAEKLLDSRPEGRREVLASIVDLDRYERLHKSADDRRKALEGERKGLEGRLGAVPEVLPLQLAEAKGLIEDADEARQQARAEVERLQGLEHEARGWVELQKRLDTTRERIARARRLLEDAPAIETKLARLRELREVLPRVHEIVVFRGQAHEADAKAKALLSQREKAAAALTQRDHALKQAKEKRSSLLALIAQDEAKHAELSRRVQQSATRLAKLNECERQESDLARLREELARLPADPGRDVATAREQVEALAGLSRLVPTLVRFRARRAELAQALECEQSAQQALEVVKRRGEGLKAEATRLEPLAAAAARALAEASEEATTARAQLEQARESLREVSDLDGAKVCRHCGQALTEKHVKEEKKRRAKEVTAAQAKFDRADAVRQKAQQAEAKLREELAAAQAAYQEARLEYPTVRAQGQQARQDADRLREECGQAYDELTGPYRARIAKARPADWLATAYPSEADVEAVRGEARGLEPARQALRKAEAVQEQWGKLKARESAALEQVNRLLQDLPRDRERVRTEHARLEADEKSTFHTLDANRQARNEVDADLERLGRERDRAQADLNDLDAKAKEQELVRHNAERGVASHLKQLPPEWQGPMEKAGIRERFALEQEKEALEAEGVDVRGRELEAARSTVGSLEHDLKALEAEQGKFGVEARQGPASVAERLTQAKVNDRATEKQLSDARAYLALLEKQVQAREQIEKDCLAVEKDLASQRLLAELLGRERLQLYLVRQAERQVVEYANAVLDRLSGGQLYLKLTGEANGEGAAAKALELEAYNRATGERPINVAFLSGSQKFRVAVSLALGIGQYASRQHRPIESVIIDEGFGCLDTQGRVVMIQELQNLRSQMRCILLVSHQEDFAEAFSDGYHFQLEGGATRVRRFQK
jgi:exonuclease SbcC